MFNLIKRFFKTEPPIPPKIIKVTIIVKYHKNEKHSPPKWEANIYWDNGDYEHHNGGYSSSNYHIRGLNTHEEKKTIRIICDILNWKCSSIFNFVKKDLLSLDCPYGIQPYGAFVMCNVRYLPEAMQYCGFEVVEISNTKKLHSYEFRF